MFKQIMVAYDGSESANKAFGYGLDLAEKYGAGLYVLSVARPPDFAEEVETEAVLNHSRDHYRKAMEPLRKRAEASAAKVHFEVAVGHPAEQIIYHAEHYGADLIIVGHRGKTFFQRWLLGSIAKQTLDHAPCAVLVTR